MSIFSLANLTLMKNTKRSSREDGGLVELGTYTGLHNHAVLVITWRDALFKKTY